MEDGVVDEMVEDHKRNKDMYQNKRNREGNQGTRFGGMKNVEIRREELQKEREIGKGREMIIKS